MAHHETAANKILNWSVVEYDSSSLISGHMLKYSGVSGAVSTMSVVDRTI
jgi:hypothetical protein